MVISLMGDVFFSKMEEGKPNVKFLKDYFFQEGRIKEEHALYIINKVMQLLHPGPNTLTLGNPIPSAPAIALSPFAF